MKKFLKEKYKVEHHGSFTHKNRYPSYPSKGEGYCGTPSCEIPEEPTYCQEETFDASQIRYKIGCSDSSKLRDVGIEKGARLDYILEELWQKVRDFNFVETPRIPGKPALNTFQAVVSEMFGMIQDLREEIYNLKQKIKEDV